MSDCKPKIKPHILLTLFILSAGLIFFLVMLIIRIIVNTNTFYKNAILMASLTFFGYIILACAIIVYLFIQKNKSFLLGCVWVACFIFSILFFTEYILKYSATITELYKTLESYINSEPQQGIDFISQNISLYKLMIIANSVFLAGSAITFGGLAIYQFYLTRPVKAE